MHDSSRNRAGVNAPAHVAALELVRWQHVLQVIFGAPGAVRLQVVDHRAMEAFGALSSGQWLSALVWLGGGPVVDARASLADPLGALLASVVLRVVGQVGDTLAAGRGSPYWRTLVRVYCEALHRRPQREPMTWALECLLCADGGPEEGQALERAAGVVLEPWRVEQLAHAHAIDWEAEALANEWVEVLDG